MDINPTMAPIPIDGDIDFGAIVIKVYLIKLIVKVVTIIKGKSNHPNT